ncbi:MAG: twin-arginine translocase TatA/TatE family subunit [Candidatus Eremiobacteraeota bacterium]|nr:twin-arginine translocase TatA/TatE family subunit [Candidatus Eremiobacteraeota bacterium]MBV8221903.1 twin-arginine translocase TatA/TatE family subunit [Candidatus Eremiobacteraeota bacterium]
MPMTPIYAVIDAPIIAIIIAAAVILFGAERIPKLARSMGQAKKEFDAAMSGKPGQPDPSSGAQPAPGTSQTSSPPTAPSDPSTATPPQP